MLDLVRAIDRLTRRGAACRDFSAEEMALLFDRMLDPAASTPAQIAAFLVALRMKGETVDELVGAARAMRARAVPIALPADGRPWIDTCGTGGDGSGSLNVSTLGALVAAACGAPVAKHGNRAQSSQAGSADLLRCLGVHIDAAVPQVERCLREVGIGFLFAPAFHGATRHAAAVRREIGVRTVFNLLGPLTNPAGVRRQVVGVYDAAWVEPVCRALGQLGCERALVVHGTLPDGKALDEVAPVGETQAAEWRDGEVRRHVLTPASFGFGDDGPVELDGPAGLRGGDPAHNAERARAILEADPREQGGAAWRAVILAAACALHVSLDLPLPDGAARAEQALRDGSAQDLLARLARTSHAP
jgi:anthranilate phosphoribosyltransferase